MPDTSSGLYNFTPASLAGLTALAGFFPNVTQQSGTSKTSGTQSNVPNLGPGGLNFITNLMKAYSSITPFSTQNYIANASQAANQNADTQRKAAAAIMASRGLSTSPAAATTDTTIDQNRINQITQADTQAPILARQQQMQDLQTQAQFAALLPTLFGTTSTNQGSGTTTGQSSVGGGIGGSISGLAQIMAILTTMGKNPGNILGSGNNGTSIYDILADLASGGGTIFSGGIGKVMR